MLPALSHPFNTPDTQHSYMIFISNLDPCPRYLKNKLKIFKCILHPPGSQIYFKAPHQYTYINRNTDANKTIYTFLTWFYNLPYPRICADLNRLFTAFGIKHRYLHVLSLPHFPS